jgi:DNA repair exonuclease SbcCD ATPase subunit
MRILQFTAENFKKIRVVEIVPKGTVTTISGRNGQGKTSVLDALWATFAGKKAIPEKPVRKGADKSRLSATLSDEQGHPFLLVKRTIAGDRTTQLTVEAAKGAQRPAGTPQAVLDSLIGEMSFDPIAFIGLPPKEQVNLLRTLVKVGVDFEAIAQENERDYNQRREIKRRAEQLQTEANAISFSPGLPKEKINEVEILGRISEVGERNKTVVARIEEKTRLAGLLRDAEEAEQRNNDFLAKQRAEVERLERLLELARQTLSAGEAQEPRLQSAVAEARLAWEQAQGADLEDTHDLMYELERARLVNREIDRRGRHEELHAQSAKLEHEAQELTRAMEGREERKREALAAAQMPVEGLTFNEEGVLFHGIPLQQLGEGEQIRVGCALAMASNPKLRAIPIHRGESLDDKNLALIEKMAEEQDFQIFMTKVDTSGKVGIVLEDGMVESVNE